MKEKQKNKEKSLESKSLHVAFFFFVGMRRRFQTGDGKEDPERKKIVFLF